ISGTSFNTIGDTADKAGNVISGNLLGGILISSGSFPAPGFARGNLVAGNRIGTNKDGTAMLPNWGSTPANGVTILNSSSNMIGGEADGAANVISGNTGDGIRISGGFANFVQGNFIGTQKDGTTKLGNSLSGVFVTGG